MLTTAIMLEVGEAVFLLAVRAVHESVSVASSSADRQERVASIAELIGGLKSAKSLTPNVVEEAETHIGLLKELRRREKELTRDFEKVFLKYTGEEKPEKKTKAKKK